MYTVFVEKHKHNVCIEKEQPYKRPANITQ